MTAFSENGIRPLLPFKVGPMNGREARPKRSSAEGGRSRQERTRKADVSPSGESARLRASAMRASPWTVIWQPSSFNFAALCFTLAWSVGLGANRFVRPWWRAPRWFQTACVVARAGLGRSPAMASTISRASATKSCLRGVVRRKARPIVRLGSGAAKRKSLIRSSRTSASIATSGKSVTA